jgi:hypothetical protein
MASGLRQHAEVLAGEAPYEERYWARATPGTSAAEAMTEGDFAADFKSEPFEAIRTLCAFVEFGLVTRVEATKWLFPLLVKARGDLREHIYETLLRLEEPDLILIVALVLQRGFEMWCNSAHHPCMEGGQQERTDRHHNEEGHRSHQRSLET